MTAGLTGLEKESDTIYPVLKKPMSKIKTTKLLHEKDWIFNKSDDSNLDNTLRYRNSLNLICKYRPEKIFDTGCGSGVLGRMIKKVFPDTLLHGCDISKPALDKAENYYEMLWESNLDREDIPAKSSFYDLVTCSEVLEHIYDVNHVLMEIKRILKKNGIALLTVPNLTYWRYRIDIFKGKLPIPADDDRHIHQFTQYSMLKKLKTVPFKIIAVTGHSIKIPRLAKWKPSLFSDTLFFEIKKQ